MGGSGGAQGGGAQGSQAPMGGGQKPLGTGFATGFQGGQHQAGQQRQQARQQYRQGNRQMMQNAFGSTNPVQPPPPAAPPTDAVGVPQAPPAEYQHYRPGDSRQGMTFDQNAQARKDFERQQFINSGGDPNAFKAWEDSGMGGQTWDSFEDPAARNAARTKYYHEQFQGIQQAPPKTESTTGGTPPPTGGEMPPPPPTAPPPAQVPGAGNLSQLFQNMMQGGGK